MSAHFSKGWHIPMATKRGESAYRTALAKAIKDRDGIAAELEILNARHAGACKLADQLEQFLGVLAGSQPETKNERALQAAS